jgi:WW domain-containing oxidoreductase
MQKAVPFGSRSTADQVLAGIDLTGKYMLVTGCNSGLGFETMNAFAANGAHVIGLARDVETARHACREASPRCIPIGCDLSDLDSVREAVHDIGALEAPIDAIIANAAVGASATLHTHNGVAQQLAVNHLGHFALLNGLAPLIRTGSGRIVIVSDGAALARAPKQGILFDNLDGSRFYDADSFYAQAKLANVLFAKDLGLRLQARGISVNSVNPGITRGTGLRGARSAWSRALRWLPERFWKTPAQGAATQAFVAANPQAAGITGEYWADCKIAPHSPLLEDTDLMQRLWETSVALVHRQGAQNVLAPMLRAA